LDGGGIRGVLSLGFLERIERLLRVRHQNEQFRLCDYFDLIGGTSTGAIIAGGLAIGMEVAEIKRRYLDLGGKIFGRKSWRAWRALFDVRGLEEELQNLFGDRTLDDASIRTGLCIVAKRADTGSTWPLINHPNGKYFALNRSLLLRNVVRASTAAPMFFVPAKYRVGRSGSYGAFVDGGVSMANNPALLLFLIATLKKFPFGWPTGEDKLLLVSIGTGHWDRKENVDIVSNRRLWDWAREVPTMLMRDANWHNQLILQYLSNTRTPWSIDDELGDLTGDLLLLQPALTYLRYDVRLDAETLHSLELHELADKAESLWGMSAAENRVALAAVGDKAAQQQVKEDHFSEAFDLKL
jgi:patatin-like phospholipase/acyl hydrolase